MNNLTVIVPIVIAFSGLLVWLLFPRRNSSGTATSSIHSNLNESIPTPTHFRYFPQIRQALSSADAEYLMKTAPPGVAKRALRERRKVARHFLQGLNEDFSKLARLARIVATLSPQVSKKQETRRLILTLNFRILYVLVWLRLSTGNIPLQHLEHLTGLVGRLAARMDEAMTEIGALSAGQLPGRNSA
jgi:hypothetical protein